MFDVFYEVLKPSLKDLQLHYMDNDSFVLSISENKFSDEHSDLTNLNTPDKTNEKTTR